MFQISYGNSLLFFNLSNKRIIHLLSFIIVIIFLSSFFFFSFLFSMPCNFCPWRLYRNFCHTHSLFPYLLPRPPFWVFNLAGFFCLNFCLGCPFEFSTWQAFFFFFQTLYFLSLSMLIGWSISSPFKSIILVAPLTWFSW